MTQTTICPTCQGFWAEPPCCQGSGCDVCGNEGECPHCHDTGKIKIVFSPVTDVCRPQDTQGAPNEPRL